MDKINFTPFPDLKTERLNLRELKDTDKTEIFALRSSESVMKFIARPRMEAMDEAQRLINRLNGGIANNEWIFWGITLKGEKKIIGTACIWNISEKDMRAEIGYDLMPEFQGKGLMQEAVQAVLDYGFNTLNLHSMEANINPDNAASIKLIAKHNFIREAYFKENVFFGGQFRDTVIYSLINPGH
jgi:ribosomal-protein-alanine N-acetyltransferase